MSYEDVIEEIIETIEEDKNCDRFTVRYDIERILDKFVNQNTWQLKGRIRELEDEIYRDRRGNL